VKDSLATQRNRILGLLTAARGAWVPLPQISQCAAQYNARIHELRRMGFRVPPPRTETVNGQRHTWYRLEVSAEIAQARPEPRSVFPVPPTTFPEFGSLAPESYGVD
jgi:hypothetical protein